MVERLEDYKKAIAKLSTETLDGIEGHLAGEIVDAGLQEDKGREKAACLLKAPIRRVLKKREIQTKSP